MDLLKSIAALVSGKKSLWLTGVSGSMDGYLLARAAEESRSVVVAVVPDMDRARRLVTDSSFFTSVPVMLYPCHDTVPFVPILPSKALLADRIEVLYRLAMEDGSLIVVVPVQAILEPTIPREVLESHWEYVRRGMVIDREKFVEWLSRHGYERVAIVQEPGEYSVRGEILDLFGPGMEQPVRMDFFDDEVESIRFFDPRIQRSTEGVEEITVLPADEVIYSRELVEEFKERLISRAEAAGWSATKVHSILTMCDGFGLGHWQRPLFPVFYGRPGWLMEYLPLERVVMFDTWEECMEEGRAFLEIMAERRRVSEDKVLSQAAEFSAPLSVLEEMVSFRAISVSNTGAPAEAIDVGSSSVSSELLPIQSGARAVASSTLSTIKRWMEEGYHLIFQADDQRGSRRIEEILKLCGAVGEEGLRSTQGPCRLEGYRGISLVIAPLISGFIWDRWRVVSQRDLFGVQVSSTRDRRGGGPAIQFDELQVGDYVVHRDHGIGIYRGLETLDIGGVTGEFLHLEYKGGDKLFLPVHRLSVLERYVGIEGREPALDRLGGKTWALKTQKVKKAIREIAHELVELYAKRKVREGFAFSPPDELYREFEAAFPHEETPDQAIAIREILEDMQSTRPMDRLLCGDVGYGKTEVAMRAAFKAVLDKKQVAVLVPTTLLAEQHERTFLKRFSRFPVEIAALSRLKPRREQREILRKVKEHEIDILIGTHRLLQSDVLFSDLGLLIVDEEHRFGVRHKERLKRLKSDVDCLSLTATPIPRTLQLSLLGVRDLSVINTPPRDRHPITTYLAAFDDSIIQEAVSRELGRGGQVYLVHNRISGLERLAGLVRRLVPDARVEIAHGQMEPSKLEEVMIRFVRREIDCLVCTTIIESGLDIPYANTIVINRADMLGLADLYQLRGRVGRSDVQAYAYLLVPRLEGLNSDARKRLRAVMEMTSAGGGFRLAMKDLQLRGAGNILGTSQSGQIAKVGYEMYLELLQAAVEELKGVEQAVEIDPEINLRVSAYIPDDYVEDVSERLRLYRRISMVTEEEQEELKEELADRFGPHPEELKNLFLLMEVKRLLRRLNVVRCDGDPCGQVALAFHPSGPSDPERLLLWASKRKNVRFSPDERLIFPVQREKNGENGLFFLIKLLHEMVGEATKS